MKLRDTEFLYLYMRVPNLLIIAGTGNKSGKTSMACRIISQFRHLNIVSVKITPHFHEPTPGLILISEKSGYSVYEETDSEITKDTSRMLKAGASKVIFARVNDDTVLRAFQEILDYFPPGTPLVCESPFLRYYAEPGLFIIMQSSEKDNNKDIYALLNLPHVEFNLNYLSGNEDLPLLFSAGIWSSWHYGKLIS
jgi:hypothetical protein